MPPTKSKAEVELNKQKLANSYNELLQEFSSKDLRHVGNYTLGKLIGKGSFGKVYLARHNLTNGSKVVLKSSKKDDANLAREIHHHRQFLHPHIVRLYEVIVTENLVWLVLEYCPGDELYNYLLTHGALSPDKVQKIFAQLVGAVSYIHNKSCVHRDLKLENIMLDKNENVKLCDFGFTREYDGKASYLQTFCGTICYSAPEMLKGEKYAGEKVDVWSLGIILYALLTGELPFDDDDDQATKAKIMKEEPKYGDSFPEQAKSLCSKLLAKRPLYRPSLAEILAHPFLTEHAPQQQVILKLAQPAPFTTQVEKATLERMKSAGVNIDNVIENVLSQRCDSLAGWWALLIEKEERKEVRRDRKRKEREAEQKSIRRISATSSRLLGPTLAEVSEEHTLAASQPSTDDEARPRGRRHRRSTPQIVVPDLPKLPEGSAIETPVSETPPAPLEKDSVRSNSTSRPPPPPKDFQRRRSSQLMLVTTNSDIMKQSGIVKRRRRNPQSFMGQLASIKHWFIESTKRAKSPGKSGNLLKVASRNTLVSSHSAKTPTTTHPPPPTDDSAAGTLTPTSAHAITPITTTKRVSSLNQTHIRPISTLSQHGHRDSLSPSPMTPRSTNYRRTSSGQGLRGRKSTSSSVSSIRSIHHRHSHSKASSTSSRNSIDTTSTPTAKSTARSPHPSIKVLPTTPAKSTTLPSHIRLVRGNPSASSEGPHLKPSPFPIDVSSNANSLSAGPHSPPATGLVYARRRKSPFRGPLGINTNLSGFNVGNGQGTPGLRGRHDSGTNPFDRVNGGATSVSDTGSERGRGRRGSRRKLPTFTEEEEEEEEEEEGEENDDSEDDDEVEEVDVFSPVVLKRGESIHTITLLEDSGKLTQQPPDALANEETIDVIDVDKHGEYRGRRSLSVDTRGRVSMSRERPTFDEEANISPKKVA